MHRLLVVAVAAVAGIAAGCSGGEGGSGSSSDPVVEVVVAPSGATIDTSTDLRMKATGVTESGRQVALEQDVEWSSDNGTIDADGTFTPGSAGTANITALWDDLEGSGTVTVVAPGTLTVTIVDAATLQAIEGAAVALVGSADNPVMTGADGGAELEGEFAGAVDVIVTAEGYWPLTVFGLKNKLARLPIRAHVPPPTGTFDGVIEFEEAFESDSPEAGNLWVGIGGPAVKGNILAFGLDALLGEDRTLQILGSDVNAPSNLYVHGITDNYVARAPSGESVIFAMGGEVPISEITDLIEGGSDDLGEIIAALIPIFNSFYYTANTGVMVPESPTVLHDQDLVLDTPLSRRATLAVPARPIADPNPLVVATVDFGPEFGFLPAGLNIVDGENETGSTVRVPPLTGVFDQRSYMFLVVSQEGGLGGSNDDQQIAVLARGVTSLGDDVQLPEFLDPPPLAGFSGVAGTATFGHGATAGADFVFHTLTRDYDSGTVEWDVLAPGDSDGFVLPMMTGTHAATAGGNWTVQTLGMVSQTYESLFVPGASVNATNYFNDANRVVITNASVE